MAISLRDLLQNNVKKIVHGIGINNQGNIYQLIVGEVERNIIEVVLQETNYNLVQTAKLLGISRTKLYRKLKAFNLPLKQHQPFE
ncbi:MAG: PAS modulated sigma54 specific transcriptional regulator, Fis family [candidate division TM6 bacterium GW2011_GWF2_38_10]|nr:MAG: PAS modulated sigma54 specific transcriptional regulator, Fis family [candidate division TM6 bacterium GW2011_GWF2_38_10]